MESDLQVINQFLSDFPYEVLARGTEELDEEFREKLDMLASGKYPEEGRDDLSRDILVNPDALDYLSELAKRRQESESVAE